MRSWILTVFLLFGAANSASALSYWQLLSGMGQLGGTEARYIEPLMRSAADRPDLLQAILAQALELKRQRLPVEPFLLKAQEGLAKKQGPDRLWPALHQVQRDTQELKALSRGASPEQIRELYWLKRRGYSSEQLSAFIRTLPKISPPPQYRPAPPLDPAWTPQQGKPHRGRGPWKIPPGQLKKLYR